MTNEPIPAAPVPVPREDRRRELARLPKARLIRMLQPFVMTAHPLTTWTKDEIVASLLDREFPPPPPAPMEDDPAAYVPASACWRPAEHGMLSATCRVAAHHHPSAGDPS